MRGIDDDLWRGSILIEKDFDSVILYCSIERLPLDEMKQHIEGQLANILKVWHDAYEELAK